MNYRTPLLLSLVLLAVAVAPATRAAAPEVISYQGLLTDDLGVVVDDDIYGLRFEIYDSPVAGTLLFQQSLTVSVVDGLYNVLLSTNQHPSGATLPEVFASDMTYMGIVIESGPGIGTEIVLSPRQQIASVPYALTAGAASIPAGIITMWSGSVGGIPEGWALCDGTNSTPDLSGRFVVGYDSGDVDYSAVGNTGGTKLRVITEANIEQFNTNTTGSHTHGYTRRNSTGTADGGNNHPNINQTSANTGSAGNHAHTVGTSGATGADIRPSYYVVAFIMKL